MSSFDRGFTAGVAWSEKLDRKSLNRLASWVVQRREIDVWDFEVVYDDLRTLGLVQIDIGPAFERGTHCDVRRWWIEISKGHWPKDFEGQCLFVEGFAGAAGSR